MTRFVSVEACIGVLLICTATAHAASAAQGWAEPGARRDGVHIRVGRDYYLSAGREASSKIVVIGASATILGHARDTLIVVGGSVRIGETARVDGDVVAIGGEVQIADGARVAGEVRHVTVAGSAIPGVLADWARNVDRTWWALLGLLATLIRLALSVVAASVAALLAPAWVRRVAEQTRTAPVVSTGAGIVLQLMIGPLTLAVVFGLLISLVGIPLLIFVPMAVMLLLGLWIAAFAGVAVLAGRGMRQRTTEPSAPVLEAAGGTILIALVTLVGHVLALGPRFFAPLAGPVIAAGLLLEYLAWSAALGAAFTSARRAEFGPPPVPVQPVVGEVRPGGL